MPYSIKIAEKAAKSLKKIPETERKKIIKKIDSLKETPRPESCKKLKRDSNLYRIRSGNYRIIYEIEDGFLKILVLIVGHRKSVYR